MSQTSFPFAVRLIGFPPEEADAFENTFAIEQGKGYGYFRLGEDNLQDPDLYIANADELRALVALADLKPSPIRPALLVGKPSVEMPYVRVERPIRWHQVFEALDDLVEKRADALSRLEASDVVTVPERRRRDRLDVDLTDPAVYERMRAKLPENGTVLVVDKNPAFRDYVGKLLRRYDTPVAWADSESQAIEACEKQTLAVAILNTSTPGVDPYRLCRALKDRERDTKITVIFLINKYFHYDAPRAREAGADGYLTKPLAGPNLVSVLKKFMPFLR